MTSTIDGMSKEMKEYYSTWGSEGLRFHRELDTSKEYLCRPCGSSKIGFEARVDINNKIIAGPYANYICCECGAENPILVCKSTGGVYEYANKK